MVKVVASHVYPNAVASADASAVSFVVDQHLFVFELAPTALRRLARQIDDALKRPSPPAQKRGG